MADFLAQWKKRSGKPPEHPGENFVLEHRGGERTADPEGIKTVLWNGTLLNREQLQKSLPEFSNETRKVPASALVLALYKKYGPQETFSRLQGAWCALLCDSLSGEIFCASDRKGLQRLWYFCTPEGDKVFSNALSLLRKHPAFPGEWDPQKLYDYFSLLYVPGGSLYKKVQAIPPGEYLFSGVSGEYCKEYFFPSPEEDHKKESYPESCRTLQELLSAGVRKILDFAAESGSPAGVFLSGGVDSAIVAGLTASQMEKGPLHCCSIAFREKEYDERSGALQSVEHLRKVTGREIRHHIYELTPPGDFDFLSALIARSGQPFADSSLIPSALLCQFAASCGKIFLGGDGADELFHGYERYIAMRYLSKLDLLGTPVRRSFCLLGEKFLPSSGRERSLPARLRRLLKAGAMERPQRYFQLVTHAGEEAKKRLCHPDFFAGTVPSGETFDPAGFFRTGQHCSAFDIKTYLVEDCLTKTRLAADGADLTIFSPFLQEEVFSFASDLPPSFKEKNAYRKRILCDTFSPYLYAGLARSRKRGFGVPIAQWMRKEWKEQLTETLLDGEAVRMGILSRTGTESLLKEHTGSLADHSYLLYCALILELFLNQTK